MTDAPRLGSDVTRVARATTCHACGHNMHAGEQFCERCGAPAGEAGTWVAIVTADRDYFAALDPADLTFPQRPAPALSVVLDRNEVTIGRRTDADAAPCIPVDDPAASRRHACLRRQSDGTYTIVDVGSANGTCINGDLAPIARDVPVALASGDRVHVGAWTTITIERVDDGRETFSS